MRLLFFLLLSGCTVSGTGVSLTIEGPGLSPDALDVTARYAGRTVARTIALGVIPLPSTLLAELPDESLTVTFDVTARRGTQMLAQASSSAIKVEPHQIARATVVLGGGAGDGGSDGGSSDGGTVKWSVRRSMPAAGNAMTSIWGVSAADIYVTAKLAGSNLFRSPNWTGSAQSSANLNGVWAVNATDVFLVGDSATVLRGSGTTFSTETHPALAATVFNAAWGTSVNDIYAVGSGNTILHRVAGGWVVKGATTPAATVFYDVWGVDMNDVYAVGSGGTILRAQNGGSWTQLTSGVTTDLRGIWGSSANDVYVVGDQGVILHSTGNGMWSKQTTGVPAVQLMHVWGVGPSEVFVCGASWTILRSSGSGAWAAEDSGLTVDNPTTNRFNRLWGTGANDLYAVGANQTIVHRP
jgi:hypothetical protein